MPGYGAVSRGRSSRSHHCVPCMGSLPCNEEQPAGSSPCAHGKPEGGQGGWHARGHGVRPAARRGLEEMAEGSLALALLQCQVGSRVRGWKQLKDREGDAEYCSASVFSNTS